MSNIGFFPLVWSEKRVVPNRKDVNRVHLEMIPGKTIDEARENAKKFKESLLSIASVDPYTSHYGFIFCSTPEALS
jgi:hypothetical protein